jgi:outer membrane protein assembly factor BamB
VIAPRSTSAAAARRFPLTLAAALCLIATFPVWTGTARASDWSTAVGRDAARTGLSPDVGPDAPSILWQGGRPSVFAQQALAAGDILVSNRTHNINDVQNGTLIVAQNLTTGAELWTANLPWDAQSPGWRNKVSAFRDGRIYATRAGNTLSDFLYALNPANGSILWTSAAKVSEETTESLAFAENGDLVLGNFTSVMRINHTNGATVWSTPRSTPTSNGAQPAVFGNRVYVWEPSPQGPMVTAFNLTSGARLYSTPAIGGGFIQQLGLMVGPDGTVYAPRTQNNAVTDFLVAFDDLGNAFSERWRVPLGYVPFASFGFGPDGSVYSYTPALELVRLDPADGSVMNTSAPVPGNFPYQPRMAIDADGKVYLTNGGFSQGKLLAYNADLSPRWSVDVTNVNLGGPVLAGNGILVVCGVGTDVRAFHTVTLGVADAPAPAPLEILAAYPNPFRAGVRIEVVLARPGGVDAQVFDAAGRVVATLAGGSPSQGRHDLFWNGRTAAGVPAPSGVYFLRLEAGGEARETRLIRIE